MYKGAPAGVHPPALEQVDKRHAMPGPLLVHNTSGAAVIIGEFTIDSMLCSHLHCTSLAHYVMGDLAQFAIDQEECASSFLT